ncbi:hypothetical protein SAMN02787142_3733 [Burkholderia sp. WP9]|nr:hypothetical protein SAMN02787142_3733 [Burkholderia sp. WP9]
MFQVSPFSFLISFAICFALGAISTLCVGCYVNHVRQ